MNWQRLFATLQIWGTVILLSLVSGICWGVAINALSQYLFGLSKYEALYWIGIPSAIIIALISVVCLPKALRKTNMLSDEPEKFGPWFKQ